MVRPARDARGLAKALWSEGHRALVDSERRGIHGTAPAVWANTGGYGLTGDDGTLRFRFSPGDAAYKKLVSTPGLSATIVVDRASSHIMTVRFHGRRR